MVVIVIIIVFFLFIMLIALVLLMITLLLMVVLLVMFCLWHLTSVSTGSRGADTDCRNVDWAGGAQEQSSGHNHAPGICAPSYGTAHRIRRAMVHQQPYRLG